MIGFLKGALGGIWGYVAAAGAALAAVLIVLFQAKKAGQNEVIAESAKKEVENAKKANEIDRAVAVTKPDAVRDGLHKYRRD